MKNYYERLGPCAIAVVDVTEIHGGVEINRINVPVKYRRQGVGNRLLQKVTSDADAKSYVLFLTINPYGEMSYAQLEAWYMRHGFVRGAHKVYHRLPKSVTNG